MLDQGSGDLALVTESTGASDAAVQDRRQGGRLAFGGPLRIRRVGEREALFLAIICAVDMYTTLWWVTHGVAREANPLLAWTFVQHPVLFVAVKCLTCLPPLLLLTALAQKRPAFTVFLLRLTIVVYISFYILNVR